MSTTETFMQGLAADLKITNIIGLGTGVAILAIGLLYMRIVSPTLIASDVTISFIGGTVAIVVVCIGANAALGGAYVNAAASLSGVTVTSGPTAPVTPLVQTPAQQSLGQITQSQIDSLTATVQSLQTAVAALTPAKTG